MLHVIAQIVLKLTLLYAVFAGARVFFDFQICAGSRCVWFFNDWSMLAWVPLFIVYLPLAFLPGLLWAWPGLVLFWILESMAAKKQQ